MAIFPYEVLRDSFGDRMPKERITEIHIDRDANWIDVSTFGGEMPQRIRGPDEISIRDQDGDLVPEELAGRILRAIDGSIPMEEVGAKIKEVTDQWNQETQRVEKTFSVTVPEGTLVHRVACAYRGDSSFGCVCQPPTIYGRTTRWYCPCCELPRSKTIQRLCDTCERHQYSDYRFADEDHRYLLSNP